MRSEAARAEKAPSKVYARRISGPGNADLAEGCLLDWRELQSSRQIIARGVAMTIVQNTTQDHWRKVRYARQRLVLCRLMVDIMRTLHGAYAPVSEPFGTRLETFFIGLCVAIGDIEGRPFSVAKIASYMRVPRTTVIRRLAQLQSWGLIDRRGRHYYLHEKTLNSLIGMRSYQQVRRILSEATKELSDLDTLLD